MSGLSGEIIDGRYQLGELIATGGMAAIYAATDLRLDRKVAVKIMHSHLANNEEFVNRFIREAKATAALNHPNVISIQDQGWNSNGAPAIFLVIEYIDGFNLRELLAERGSLAPLEALEIFIPVASAIAAAHEIGIIHRDIKPENILISKDGRIKVGDFGLARGTNLGQTMTAEASIILGSVSYLSPEQVQRGITDFRSDVYSLGILLFEMLTGKRPYEGESAINIAYRHVNETVPAPSTLRAGIPPALDAFVQTLTANNPDQRLKDAGEVLNSAKSIQMDLDPKRRQLALELDIPAFFAPATKKRRLRPDVALGSPVTKTVRKEELAVSEDSPLSRTPKVASTTNSSLGITRRRKRNMKKIWRNRIVALLIVALLGGFGWYHYAGPGSQLSIPSLVGLSATAANNLVKPLGLHTDVVAAVFSEDVPAGRVISTDPGGGGHISPAGIVHLTISKGAERLSIPILKGLTSQSATSKLASRGLKIGNITESFSSKISKGVIIASTPTAGTKVRRNSLVNLVISKGIQQIAAADYAGQSGDQALNELTSAGFVVGSSYAFSDTIAAGLVISQTPAGGTSLNKGSKIALVISEGPAAVYIPNVYGLSTDAATRTLENLQLQVTIKRIGTKPIKVVTNISPAVGTKVMKGSAVVITVG